MASDALSEVAAELERAQRRFGPMASAHEGYAVILEEVDELWKAIKSDNEIDAATRLIQMRHEATQIAAMATRFVIDVCDALTVAQVLDQRAARLARGEM